ncbi:hypothetical protein ZWY2020_054164 [Hordeum vulgare]|nr:hypothetical protein ZWY2020_054164 [Hordeum vulgare]
MASGRATEVIGGTSPWGEPRASGFIRTSIPEPPPLYLEHSAAATTASDLSTRSFLRSLAMSAAALRAQLNALVTSMFATGTVDEYFQYLQSMDEDGSSGPGLVAEVINLFIGNANGILNDITGLLNQPVPDFDKVDDLVHQLKGCSCSVGAKKVNLSCMHFNQYIEARSKEGCLMALALLMNEFCDVCNKFQTMMQLEQQIAAYGPK